jgi:TolB-like protein/tetratricopeptide (TPR) repeat protein
LSLFNEFKRRGVFKVSVAYIVIGWIMLQVSATLEETLELPDWFDKFTLSTFLLGFPLALLLAWAYDIHPDSSQPTSPATSGKTVFIAMLVALVLGGSGYSYYIFRSSAPLAVSQTAVVAHTPTIAVLPFADFSPAGDQVWFADGISEEILNVLTRTKGLKVASRKASFHFRDEDIDLKTVAAELNVETILEGSVRTQGDQLRITAQLINAADGFHIWSDTYDRQMKDIFAVQDEIATNIATALFGELGVEALPEQRFKGTANIEAYSYYLHGMEKLNRVKLTEKTKAAPYFDRALALDPDFADAWVGLAITESIQRYSGLKAPTISPSLRRALTLDPNNADAIAGLAWVNRHVLHWFESEQLFLRAISLDPNNATVRLGFGQFLRTTGRVPEALNELLKAWDLGSTDQNLGSLIINTYSYLGKFPEARTFYESQLADVGLENMRGNQAYFVALLADGMEVEARAFAAQDVPGPVARARIRFFLEQLDGNPDAGKHLIESSLNRIEETRQVYSSDIEGLLLAGEVDLARKYVPRVQGYAYGAPNRFGLFVNEDIDPRYLPYRGNLLLLHDMYPAVVEAYLTIGVDLVALGKEKGFLE